MEQKEYLQNYERSLASNLISLLASHGEMDDRLLTTDDFYDLWDKVAASYAADSVGQFSQYPTVALGWAAYLGMAVAKMWDGEWQLYSQIPNLYEYLRDQRGYDYFDEEVRSAVLGLEGEEYDKAEQLVRSCAQLALSQLHHEHAEPQTAAAYYLFMSTVKVMYHVGASIQLRRMGYRLHKC